MFLAIDVGNTQTTLGLFDERGGFAHGWRMSTTAADTSDMLHSRLWGFFMKDGLSLADVTDAGVASVVPALERAWRRCLKDHLGHDPLVVSAGEGYGMEVAMPNPRQVGAGAESRSGARCSVCAQPGQFPAVFIEKPRAEGLDASGTAVVCGGAADGHSDLPAALRQCICDQFAGAV